jgi:hypothetical protein
MKPRSPPACVSPRERRLPLGRGFVEYADLLDSNRFEQEPRIGYAEADHLTEGRPLKPSGSGLGSWSVTPRPSRRA